MKRLYCVLRPAALIIAGGVIGYFIGGGFGCIAGLVAGYLSSLLLGSIFIAMDRGILPKAERARAAEGFLRLNRDILKELVPGEHVNQEQRYIESLLERIYREAMGIGAASGYSLEEAEIALQIIKDDESDPKTIRTLDLLWTYVKKEWYDAGK